MPFLQSRPEILFIEQYTYPKVVNLFNCLFVSEHIRHVPLLVGNKTADVYSYGSDIRNRAIVTVYRDSMEYISLIQNGYDLSSGKN